MSPTTTQVMHFSLEFWQIILLSGMLISAFSVAFSVAFRFYKASVELQLAAMKAEFETRIRHLEADVSQLKTAQSHISSQMLLREDWIRESVANHQVQDQLRLQMQQVMNMLITIKGEKGAA